MNPVLENFIHHSWKQKSHTSQKCKVGPMDVTWLGSPPGGFSNLLAWLETSQQVSFTRVEGVKRSQELISSCEIPQREMAVLSWWRREMKVYPILGLGFVYTAKYFYGLHAALPGRVVVFNTFIFCGQRKGWYLCFSGGRHEWQCRVPPHTERMEISTACLSSRASQEELYLSRKNWREESQSVRVRENCQDSTG